MRSTMFSKYAPAAFRLTALAAGLALSACGGGSDNNIGPAPQGNIQGVAAVGAPIRGGAVTVKCADGSQVSGSSDNAGRFAVDVSSASAMPCAIKVTGNGRTVFSLATEFNAQRTNATPLTRLGLALAVGQPLNGWFNANPSTELSNASTGLLDAARRLRTAMRKQGYDIPTQWTQNALWIFSAVFNAQPNDIYDELLEQLARAAAAEGSDDDTLESNFIGADDHVPPRPDEDGGSTGGNTTGGTTGGGNTTGGNTTGGDTTGGAGGGDTTGGGGTGGGTGGTGGGSGGGTGGTGGGSGGGTGGTGGGTGGTGGGTGGGLLGGLLG